VWPCVCLSQTQPTAAAVAAVVVVAAAQSSGLVVSYGRKKQTCRKFDPQVRIRRKIAKGKAARGAWGVKHPAEGDEPDDPGSD
jgi:hypothetical protein